MDRQLVRPSRAAIDAVAHADHDAANAATGLRFVRALSVEKAALDPALSSKCVFVLAAILYFMNSTTGRAWPSYRRIAELTGYSVDSIERAIRELKEAGYLFTERRAPPNGGRAVVQYGLGAVCPNDIDNMLMLTAAVTAAVGELRKRERGSDPGNKPGVRDGLTPVKKSGSAPDPDISVPSDPVNFLRQEPIEVEPISGEREDLSSTGNFDGRIAAAGKLKRRQRGRAEAEHPLPNDWQPGNAGFAYALEKGLSEAEFDEQFESFREWHIGKQTKWARWDIAWQRWVRKAVQWRSNQKPRASRGSNLEAVIDRLGWGDDE